MKEKTEYYEATNVTSYFANIFENSGKKYCLWEAQHLWLKQPVVYKTLAECELILSEIADQFTDVCYISKIDDEEIYFIHKGMKNLDGVILVKTFNNEQ